MKIWFPVITGNSGTDVFTRRLAGALNRRGISTEITWYSTNYQFAPALLKKKQCPPGTDIIHANAWNAFAFQRHGIPLVATEHQGVYGWNLRPYRSTAQQIYHATVIRKYVMASLQCANSTTTVSHFSLRGMQESLSARGVKVIYNWIDTELFKPLPSSTKPASGIFRLLYVGNLSWLKGTDILVEVMKKLGPSFELRYTAGLKTNKLAIELPNMVAIGRLNTDKELVSAYQTADAVIIPSRFEGFGYPAVEAMACGKPVIASAAAALPEIVENNVGGIICTEGGVDSFVAGCKQLKENPDLTSRLGSTARNRAVERFSEDVIVPQYIELYRQITS